MRILVGAPVHQRAWVLPSWFGALRAQEGVADWAISFVFNYGESTDETIRALHEGVQSGGWTYDLIVDDGDDHVAKRTWNVGRYETMVRLRNRLLDVVRAEEPDYYLSLDTDILLPPHGIRTLVEELEKSHLDGVSPLMYMTPRGVRYPNTMELDSTQRVHVNGDLRTRQVPAAFAAKLMSPDLYRQVDYAVDKRGEDLGWAVNVAESGLRLGIVPQVKAKHIMEPWMLNEVDERVGW